MSQNAFEFSSNPGEYQPLAARLRPSSITQFVGQQHLIDVGKPLRKMIDAKQLHSMILWGPPGTGKTTLATIIANEADADVIKISAVLSGVKEIRQLVEQATSNQGQGIKTLVFVDEVHRFNKSQQDAFLPHVESGLFTFIGATTENPSFEVNNALLSRARVYVLKSLQEDDILAIIKQALQDERAAELSDLDFADELQSKLAQFVDGDARMVLNLLELINSCVEERLVTAELLTEILANGTRRFDAGGEDFYNQISALHKSVRGSAVDASLYWLARMLDGGCDPLYIARRIVRMASEDIGNADPRALDLAMTAYQTQERLGSPEGDLALAQAVAYLAVAPKSNAVYVAFNKAKQLVEQTGAAEIPLQLRNAPTQLMKSLDYGKHYRYAHDEPDAYAAGESYFPEGLENKRLYHPVDRGLEKKIKEKLNYLREQDSKYHQKG
jgi:putative ATPase